jgi:hypothetical protein
VERGAHVEAAEGGGVKFYLGAHHPHWLRLAGVPLFVSRRSLGRYKTLPRAAAPWALDSGGFTELAMHGEWKTTPSDYVAEVRRYRDEIGSLDFAAPQDWMCEPAMLARTGLRVADHQQRSTNNYLELRALAPDLPFIPVLQGWSIVDYWCHAEQYEAAGVRLSTLPLVGVGTVCRRQHMGTASTILQSLHADGLRLHGFGLKLTGLRNAAQFLASADSMAWSYNARREPPMLGHTHKNCANCMPWAMGWRERALAVSAHG